MITYQLHICNDGYWESDTIIYAANQEEMIFCLKQLGFKHDAGNHYVLDKGELSYWAEPCDAMHVADLKEKL